MSKRKESGVYQRHTRRCPRKAGGRGYVPHRCTGTWFYVIDVGRDSTTNDRQQETKGGFLTAQDATEARAARLSEVRSRTADAHSITVGAYLDLWLSRKRALRESTRTSYRYHLDQYLIPRLGSLRLVDLERCPDHIEDMSDLLIGVGGKPLSAASVRRIHATLRNALNAAVKRKMLGHNPALAVELPPTGGRGGSVWTAEQAATFLDHVRDDRLYAMYVLVVLCGLRRGETVGLRWDDVDLDQGFATIRQQVVEVGSALYVRPPKTKAGDRLVAFPPIVVQALKRHRAQQHRERLAWGEAWTDTGLVFAREDGRMLRPASVSIGFRALCDKAGVPVIRFHDLRHTCATLALLAEVETRVVSEMLGHSTTAITENLYQKVLPQVAFRAAARIAGSVPHVAPADDGLAAV